MHTPVFHFLTGAVGRNEVMILKNDGIYDIVRSRNFTKRREYDEKEAYRINYNNRKHIFHFANYTEFVHV